MFTRTLFLALIICTLALRAADDTIITLQSNDGACITIPASIAKHSATLHNIIGDCPEAAPVSTNFTKQELTTLADILNTIHQTMSDQDAITSLRSRINSESEHSFAALHDFFDIHPLRQALAEHFFNTFGLNKAENIMGKTALLNAIYKNLLASSTDENADEKTRQNAALIHRVIENMRLTDKEDFLKSKGKNLGLFFTGTSIGEAAAYELVDLHYKDRNHPFENTMGLMIDDHYINSLEGLIFTDTPIKKKKILWIQKTNIRDLPANCFQRIPNPTNLHLLYNNSLATIHPDAFAGLYTLKQLTIWNYELPHIPLGTFDRLVNLETLYLGKTTFNPLLLKYCSKLKYLHLQSNQLMEIPFYWPLACSNLRKLSLRNNDIRSITASSLNHFPQLERLSLAYNKLTHIDADIFSSCKSLTSINFKNNPIPIEEINALCTALPNINIKFERNQCGGGFGTY